MDFPDQVLFAFGERIENLIVGFFNLLLLVLQAPGDRFLFGKKVVVEVLEFGAFHDFD
ncbi:MAG: hypothetical protein ACON4R_04130 [Akkermansiaceae bacterium]